MADRYQQLVGSTPGRVVAGRLGLPRPEFLERQQPGRPTARGPVLVGPGGPGSTAGPATDTLQAVLGRIGADVLTSADRPGALVFDGTGIANAAGLRALYDFFHPVVRSVAPSGRVVLVGRVPAECPDPRQAGAQQALEGFARSLGKEIGRGRTVQLVRLRAGGGELTDALSGGGAAIESTLRFLLSARSAYVSGQVVEVEAATVTPPADWDRPLAGQVALVTGAARGIGAAIAQVLGRDGARVVCVDVPGADGLSAVAEQVGGLAVHADVTDSRAVATVLESLSEDGEGGVDVVVHNAGITRDRTLGRMKDAEWDAVLGVNLASQERFDDLLLDGGHLRAGGRIVAVSSISGLAGNAGQTNYATSKAGVAGRVRALAPLLRERGGTANAVAPGFIETRMTAAVPLFVREAGRRMNSMTQGGLPVDVAETIAWFAAPASAGVTGNVVRVCGQSLLGA